MNSHMHVHTRVHTHTVNTVPACSALGTEAHVPRAVLARVAGGPCCLKVTERESGHIL